jgi:hypothetical protein
VLAGVADFVGLCGAAQNAEDEGVQAGKTGGDDGKVLRDLLGECCSPVGVCYVGGVDIAVEVGEVGGTGCDHTAGCEHVFSTGVKENKKKCTYVNRDRNTQETPMLPPVDSRRFHTQRGITMRMISTTMLVMPM